MFSGLIFTESEYIQELYDIRTIRGTVMRCLEYLLLVAIRCLGTCYSHTLLVVLLVVTRCLALLGSHRHHAVAF